MELKHACLMCLIPLFKVFFLNFTRGWKPVLVLLRDARTLFHFNYSLLRFHIYAGGEQYNEVIFNSKITLNSSSLVDMVNYLFCSLLEKDYDRNSFQKKLFLSSWKIIERINYTFLMLGVTHVIAREKEIQKFTRA